MKKIIYISIILSSVFLSSISLVNANEGSLERLLQIKTMPEVYTLENIPKLSFQNFQDSLLQEKYQSFMQTDRILRKEFIRQYNAGDLTNYQMQDLIKNYGDFVYYTDKTFQYLALEEKGIRGKETQQAIYQGYSNMRTSYQRVTNIIK